MKNILLLLCLLAGLAAAACNSTPVQEEQQTETTTQQAAADSSLAYICPMACEGSASSQPGKCPVCGMDLQKNPAHTAADSAAHEGR
jgi:hypothetical protein